MANTITKKQVIIPVEINRKELLINFLSKVSTVNSNIYSRAYFVALWLEDCNYHRACQSFCEKMEIDEMEKFYGEDAFNYYIEKGTLEDRLIKIMTVFSNLCEWMIKDFDAKNDDELVDELVEIVKNIKNEY